MNVSKWIPDRKIIATGVGGVVAWLLVQVANTYLGMDIGLESATAIVGVVGTALGYLVPESVESTLRKADALLEDWAGDEDVPTGIGA